MAEGGAATEPGTPTGEPVPGSAGPLGRTVEQLPDGRRLTLYRSAAAPTADDVEP